MSGIILGPGLIGEKASKEAQRTAVDESGGGSIQVGPGLLSKKKFGKAREDELAAAAAAAPSVKIDEEVAPVEAIPAAPNADPVDLAPSHPTPFVVAEETVPGLSEDDAEVMLAADPNSWDIVAEAEGQRAEGWRPRVARMLLNAGAEAKEKPMSEEVRKHLRRIAEVGAVSEAKKLAAAVAVSDVGTGNPEAASQG